MQEVIFSPTDFVAVLNQTLEYAFPRVAIVGELSNFTVRRNKWVYFDLKDENASVKFFGSVYQLPGPLEDGMMVQVIGQPRLSPQYGFSVSFQSIQPVGEGSINKAAKLLQAKLEKEGLFDPSRKRSLPYPPNHIGLVASKESAAYADFVKILDARWGGLQITHADVQVQGEKAVGDVVKAIEALNQHGNPPEVIVITRGGGSADDLAAFSTEQVTRAVAASRIPTLVAIGHEVDISLAEMAADSHASTPSNAAELLVPDKKQERKSLSSTSQQLSYLLNVNIETTKNDLKTKSQELRETVEANLRKASEMLAGKNTLLSVLDPQLALKRGYSVVFHGKNIVKDSKQITPGSKLSIRFGKGAANATVDEVE